jgi:hypothetical protein
VQLEALPTQGLKLRAGGPRLALQVPEELGFDGGRLVVGEEGTSQPAGLRVGGHAVGEHDPPEDLVQELIERRVDHHGRALQPDEELDFFVVDHGVGEEGPLEQVGFQLADLAVG